MTTTSSLSAIVLALGGMVLGFALGAMLCFVGLIHQGQTVTSLLDVAPWLDSWLVRWAVYVVLCCLLALAYHTVRQASQFHRPGAAQTWVWWSLLVGLSLAPVMIYILLIAWNIPLEYTSWFEWAMPR